MAKKEVVYGDVADEAGKQLALVQAKETLLRSKAALSSEAQSAQAEIDKAQQAAQNLLAEVTEKLSAIDAQIAEVDGGTIPANLIHVSAEPVKVKGKRGRPKGSKNKVSRPKVKGKRGRPKGSKNKVGRPKGSVGKKNEKPLYAVVLDIVKESGAEGMKFSDLVLAVRKSGYKSNSGAAGFVNNIRQAVHRLMHTDKAIKKNDERAYIAA